MRKRVIRAHERGNYDVRPNVEVLVKVLVAYRQTAIKLGELMHGVDQRQISTLRLDMAATSWLASAAACAALTVKRNRACPRATVG